MVRAGFMAPLLLFATLTVAGAEEPAAAPPKQKSALSGMTIPIAPKLPPKLCDVQPVSLREFPIAFIGAYDGDTVAAKIDLGFGIGIQKKIRLLGVNAPDKWCARRTTQADCEEQKLASKKATEFVVDYMHGSEKGLFFKYWKDGKFGRPIGVICRHDDGKCINYELLTKQLGEYYCGGKR